MDETAATPEGLVRIQRGLGFLEAHLFERPSLAAVAAAAGVSAWHFHRVFTALTGETPGSYVRKRQTAEICRRLVDQAESLVELALAAGFESQATFTRGFTRVVGVSPARYRKARVVSPAHRYGALDLAALAARQQQRTTMEPRFVRPAAVHVVGMAGRFTPRTTSRIPQLWERFARGPMDGVPHRAGHHTFGVCMDADFATLEEDGFTYLAGVEVSRVDAVPPGMIAITVPARTYAVLTHHGHIARLPDTVKYVFGTWLPASGHRHVASPDFERYDERWEPTTGEGEIDIWVPIAEEASA